MVGCLYALLQGYIMMTAEIKTKSVINKQQNSLLSLACSFKAKYFLLVFLEPFKLTPPHTEKCV